MKIPKFKALVPMKHHSERVPEKNIRQFCGKPLLHWIMQSLCESRYVDEIIVNTDSDVIAEAVATFGATVLQRPDHLLGDMVGIQPLIEWDLAHSNGEYYLQTHSTNPLLTSTTIDRAIEDFYANPENDSLFSVTPLQTRFYWPDGTPVNHDPDNLVRTQDLPEILEENSCIYVFSRRMFEKVGHRLGANPLMFRMDFLEALDIDEEYDFTVAEAVMQARISGNRSMKARS